MKLVYVAGPYRATNPKTGKSDAWGVQSNIMRAMGLALEVWKAGGAALCPHANTMFYQDAAGINDEVWLNGDLVMLERCDAILMTPDYERSSGARAELDHAKMRGIPVFFEMNSLKSWMGAS